MGNGGQEHHNSAKVRFNVRNYYAYLLLLCVLNSFVCQHKSNMQACVRGCGSVCVCGCVAVQLAIILDSYTVECEISAISVS